MDCARVKAEGITEHYVLGTLAEAEQEAFEEHLVTCADCANELAGLCALKAELERGREEIVADAGDRSSPWRRPWVLAVAAAVMAAAIGLTVWMRSETAPAPETILAEMGPVTQPEMEPAPGPGLPELAAFEPPAYSPVRLRGSEDDAARRFREAMKLYAAGDWRGALPGLRAAAALDPKAPHIAFYLGACALLAGETDEAIVELERTAALGDTPFLEEALFSLAKAQLRAGDVDAARGELVKVVALDGDRMEEAQGLLGRLDALEGRRSH